MAFLSAIDEIVSLDNSENCQVSVLVFSDECSVHCLRVRPSQMNKNITYPSGGTDFQKPFSLSYELMKQDVTKFITKFIFMTDGYAPFPAEEIKQIKLLQNNYPSRIHYHGI